MSRYVPRPYRLARGMSNKFRGIRFRISCGCMRSERKPANFRHAQCAFSQCPGPGCFYCFTRPVISRAFFLENREEPLDFVGRLKPE